MTWSGEAGAGAGRGMARLSCSVRYSRPAAPSLASRAPPAHTPARKLTARIDIDKDDIQAVLPISKVCFDDILFILVKVK